MPLNLHHFSLVNQLIHFRSRNDKIRAGQQALNPLGLGQQVCGAKSLIVIAARHKQLEDVLRSQLPRHCN